MKISRLMVLLALLSLTACGGFSMIENSTQEKVIKPEQGKAALVIYRHISFGGAVVFNTYLDNEIIGQTKWKSYFVAQVTPGEHYLIASSENEACAKINLEEGKVYYATQIPHIGVMKTRVALSAGSPEEFNEQQHEMTFYNFVGVEKESLKHLEREDYDEAVSEHEKELIEDPDRHADMANLKGYL